MKETVFILTILLLSGCFKSDPNKALIKAVEDNDFEAAKTSVLKGADVNTQKKKIRLTPLIIASGNGNLKIVEMLVDKGADINAVDRKKRTPLMWAAWKGHQEVVEFLIENEADLDAKSFTGASAMFFAEKEGHTEIKQLLIESGASEIP